ncbi:hypothetical protein L0Y65_05940 [Candidatus Micrarchaeota archaeon]|nr:hypothetical protein [Candidatus Micrarchaeota archaeon]
MNKVQLFAFLVLSASFASYTYTVDVDRSGSASVTLSLEGGDAVNVSMPQDASNIRMVGGSYSVMGNTSTVSAGPSGLAAFSFSTSLFTTKTESGWKLAFAPPEGAGVRIYAPPYSAIENSYPQPESVTSDDSRLVIEIAPSEHVSMYYRLGEVPRPNETWDYLPYALVVLAVLIVAAAVYSRGRAPALTRTNPPSASDASPASLERPPSLDVGPGKKEMMETFNANDLTIVNHLLSCGGKSRRNELERKTGVSKSSLAMALNRLEKRKIIEIDRTSTTHFVKLSDYFLRL